MPRKGENIYKRKDGRWEARYVKGCTTEGKTAYGYCYGKTYREAKAKVTEAKARLVQNLPHTGGGTRRCFSSYCDEWLKINRSKVKESTYVKYLSMLDKHIKPKLGNYYVQSLSSVLIEQFSYELLSENGLSPKTVRDILTLLRSILKYVSRQLPSMPHIDIVYPKDSRKEMRVLNKDEQAIFTSYLLTDMDARKFGTLLALMTGMRIGEICALRWSDVDLSENVIHNKWEHIIGHFFEPFMVSLTASILFCNLILHRAPFFFRNTATLGVCLFKRRKPLINNQNLIGNLSIFILSAFYSLCNQIVCFKASIVFR